MLENDSQKNADAIASGVSSDRASPNRETIVISGKLFFDACTYVGSKPFFMVAPLRQSLYALQRKHGCQNPQTLPANVTLARQDVETLYSFLMGQPCDEVFNLVVTMDSVLRQFHMDKAAEAALKTATPATINENKDAQS